MDQTKTPYFHALLDYVDSGTTPFHTPGHKQGLGMPRLFREFVGDNVLAIDLTQVLGLDDLLQPREALLEAELLAADAYGADRSFFLINGSTSGNQAMMMAALNPGEKLLVPRNAHKSCVGALVMSGAIPVYMQPEVDEALHMDHTVTPKTVRETLDRHPDAKAVFIVSPTYYGATADLVAIERIVHERGKLLLVDEAWGPHLHFHPALPPSATSIGADLVVNSTHKMLAAMSQASMLHQIGERVDPDRLRAVLRMFLSTSPNLVMVASLDVARMQMATEGAALLSHVIELSNQTRVRLNEIKDVYCFGSELVGRPGVADFDPTKITVTVKNLGYTGYEANEILRFRYNVQCELADLFNVLALFTIGTDAAAAEKLIHGVRELAREDRPVDIFAPSGVLERRLNTGTYGFPPVPEMEMTPREAFLAATEKVRMRESIGRICAEVITPYPPGIPIIAPGERFTKEVIDYLQLEVRAGVHMQGPADPELKTVRVVA